eukprot:TRINITY_DN20039_c0_g1_i1.p1 TRINITY_DN20039_c0_g1~~TRINITY_DN20039_c0_g1_i1.p1  ORF type:complete len:1734 (+),score=333.33 TRINITY_DN20039_c0_g1_i1:69-5270(+)
MDPSWAARSHTAREAKILLSTPSKGDAIYATLDDTAVEASVGEADLETDLAADLDNDADLCGDGSPHAEGLTHTGPFLSTQCMDAHEPLSTQDQKDALHPRISESTLSPAYESMLQKYPSHAHRSPSLEQTYGKTNMQSHDNSNESANAVVESEDPSLSEQTRSIVQRLANTSQWEQVPLIQGFIQHPMLSHSVRDKASKPQGLASLISVQTSGLTPWRRSNAYLFADRIELYRCELGSGGLLRGVWLLCDYNLVTHSTSESPTHPFCITLHPTGCHCEDRTSSFQKKRKSAYLPDLRESNQDQAAEPQQNGKDANTLVSQGREIPHRHLEPQANASQWLQFLERILSLQGIQPSPLHPAEITHVIRKEMSKDQPSSLRPLEHAIYQHQPLHNPVIDAAIELQLPKDLLAALDADQHQYSQSQSHSSGQSQAYSQATSCMLSFQDSDYLPDGEPQEQPFSAVDSPPDSISVSAPCPLLSSPYIRPSRSCSIESDANMTSDKPHLTGFLRILRDSLWHPVVTHATSCGLRLSSYHLPWSHVRSCTFAPKDTCGIIPQYDAAEYAILLLTVWNRDKDQDGCPEMQASHHSSTQNLDPSGISSRGSGTQQQPESHHQGDQPTDELNERKDSTEQARQQLPYSAYPILASINEATNWLDIIRWYAPRDWNAEYQELVEWLRTVQWHDRPSQHAYEASQKLQIFRWEFEKSCLQITQKILAGSLSPILPPIQGDCYGCPSATPKKFFRHHNIVCEAQCLGKGCSEDSRFARKQLGDEYRSIHTLEECIRQNWRELCTFQDGDEHQYIPKQGVFPQLTLIIEYAGAKLFFLADPGISNPWSSVVYDSSGNGEDPYATNLIFHEYLRRMNRRLNLLGRLENGRWLYGPCCSRGYRCADDRHYIFNTVYLLPQQEQKVICEYVTEPGTLISHIPRFRPEFVRFYPEPIASIPCENRFVDEKLEENFNHDVLQRATLYLLNERINYLVDGLTQELKWPITTVMHLLGINIRYLGRVLQIANSRQDRVSRYWSTRIASEMTRRALKRECRRLWQQQELYSQEALKQSAFNLFARFLGPDGVSFWSCLACKAFPFFSDVPLVPMEDFIRLVNIDEVFEGLLSDLGIQLKSQSVFSQVMTSHKDIETIVVVFKTTSFPTLEQGLSAMELNRPGVAQYSSRCHEQRSVALQEAFSCFNQVLRQSGMYPECLMMLGICHRFNNGVSNGKYEFEACITASGYLPEAIVQMLEVHTDTSIRSALTYSMGALIRGYDTGHKIEERVSHHIQRISRSSLSTALVSQIIHDLPRTYPSRTAAVMEFSKTKTNFLDFFFYPTNLLSSSQVEEETILRLMSCLSHFLSSKHIFPAVVSRIDRDPLAVLVVGALARAVRVLCDYGVMHPDVKALFVQRLIQDTAVVEHMARLLQGPVDYGPLSASIPLAALHMITEYHATYACLLCLDEPQSLGELENVIVESLCRSLFRSSSYVQSQLILSGMSRLLQQGRCVDILVSHPELVSLAISFAFHPIFVVSNSGWRFLQLCTGSTIGLNLFVQDNVYIALACRRFGIRILQDCEHVGYLRMVSKQMAQEMEESLALEAQTFLRFLVHLSRPRGSPQEEELLKPFRHQVICQLGDMKIPSILIQIGSQLARPTLYSLVTLLLYGYQKILPMSDYFSSVTLQQFIILGKERGYQGIDQLLEILMSFDEDTTSSTLEDFEQSLIITERVVSRTDATTNAHHDQGDASLSS